jgi:hypothetical protein
MAGVKTQRLFVYCDKKSGPVITGVEENWYEKKSILF